MTENLHIEYLSNNNSLKKLSDDELKQVVGGNKKADAVLSAAIETIMEAVSEGDKVTLVGFGSFERERRTSENGSPNSPPTFSLLK